MSESRTWLWLALTVAAGWLVYLLAPVLTPFLVAALFAYLGDPLVDRLEVYKISRTMAVVAVFCVMFLLVLLTLLIILPLLERQLAALFRNLPGYLDWLQAHLVPWLAGVSGVEASELTLIKQFKSSLLAHWKEAGNIAAQLLNTVSRSGVALLAWLANLVLIPVVTFYLLRDWDLLMQRICELLPRNIEPPIVRLAKQADEVLGAFLRGQFLVMLALGVVYTFGLWIVGLDLALLVGMLAGLVSFVPYLGFIVGIVAAGTAAWMQFNELLPLLMVFGVFGVGQMLESMLLTPWLVGDRIGLHPVAVIFAVLAGGQLFGFVGVLLALPVASVIMVLLRDAHERYLKSPLYDEVAS